MVLINRQLFQKASKYAGYIAYGVAHPTAYAVVCLEIKKVYVFIMMFAGFEADLSGLLIISLIIK